MSELGEPFTEVQLKVATSGTGNTVAVGMPSYTREPADGYQGEVDIFRYAVTAPAMLTVEVAPPERASAKLEIANEQCIVLARGKPAGVSWGRDSSSSERS